MRAVSVLIALSLLVARASNWAQLGGTNLQNSAWARRPPQNLTRRYNFAFTVMQQHVVEQIATSAGAVANGASPSPSPIPIYSAPSKFFIFGGEDRTKNVAADPSFGVDKDNLPLEPNAPKVDFTAPLTGAGSLRNDIFWTRGVKWHKYTDYRLKTAYSEPSQQIVSDLEWNELPQWDGMAGWNSWKDYLGCYHIQHPFPCADPSRNKSTTVGDPDALNRRFSPRRGHSAAAAHYTDERPTVLFVMGGRARSYDQFLSSNDARGGLQTAFGSGESDRIDNPLAVHRERTLLTNDIWASYDEAETWDFTNAGCWGLNTPGGQVPLNSIDYSIFPGVKEQECRPNSRDCWDKGFGSAAECKLNPKPKPGIKPTYMCVCRHWSPRENFASTFTTIGGQPALYVSGGVGATQVNFCGPTTCGLDYGIFFRDVWRSVDMGVNWRELTPKAITADVAGHSNHRIEYAGKLLWMFGGRTVVEDHPSKDLLLNSAHMSSDGTEWVEWAGQVPWAPRRDFMTASNFDGSRIYVFGGLVAAEEVAPPPALSGPEAVTAAADAVDAPPSMDDDANKVAPAPRRMGLAYSDGSQLVSSNDLHSIFLDSSAMEASNYPVKLNRWYSDFANDTYAPLLKYLHPHWPLRVVLRDLNTTAGERAKLSAFAGVTDIIGLSQLSRAQIETFRDPTQWDLPRICELKRRAQALVDLCEPRFRAWDDWYVIALRSRFVAGESLAAAPPPPDDLCTAEPPVDTSAWDYTCRQVPPARSSGAMGMMDDKLYLFGGWQDNDYYANDLWYRDDSPPFTNITQRPKDKGSDTILDASCTKEPCVFEARFWDMTDGSPQLIRWWSPIALPYDTVSIIKPLGRTRVDLRAIDAAGNKDRFGDSYTWTYVPAFPTLATTVSLFMVALLALLIYLFYRRRKYLRELEALARRRAERKARSKKRYQRSLKRVKVMKRMKRLKVKRPKADNIYSEVDADMRNDFRELLRVRADRSRGSRARAVYDPLAPPPLTSFEPAPVIPSDVVHNVFIQRTAQDALFFAPSNLALGAKLDTLKAQQQFTVEAGLSRRQADSVTGGRRLDSTADAMRAALQVQSESYASRVSSTIVPGRIPTGIAERAAAQAAKAAGGRTDTAWDNSAMKKSLLEQTDAAVAKGKEAMLARRAAADAAAAERKGQ